MNLARVVVMVNIRSVVAKTHNRFAKVAKALANTLVLREVIHEQ